MKKIANLRAPAALCLALIAGIGAGYAAYRTGISWLYLLAAAPVCIAAVVVLAIIARDVKHVVIFALSSVFLFIGVIYGSLVLQSRSQIEAPYDENTVVGTVVSLVIGDDEREIILKDVSVNGETLEGKVLVTLSSTAGDLCDEGDVVTFTAELTAYDLITYGKVNSHIIEGVYYHCTVYAGLTAKSGFSLFGSIRSFVRNRLYNNLDSSAAGVIYAMLTGESEGVEEGIISSFRYGGVAHVFAVSGLHIGVVYGALMGFCRLIKRKGAVSSLVCLAAILFYSGICGFTVSSVRAVIMCAVSSFSRFFGTKYDTLNSLSMAVILILLINPLDLFSSGFRLSVSAVLGIALFCAMFRRRFNFLPKDTGEGLAVTLSAQIGTLPAMLSSFGYISGAGLLLNLIIVPILSTLFVVLLAGIILSAVIFPLAQPIIYVAALPLQSVLSFLAVFGFEQAALYGIGGAVFTAVYYAFMVVLSDKLNKTKLQHYTALLLAAAVAAIYIFTSAYYPFNGTYIAVSANYGGGYVLFKNSEGSVLVINEDVATYSLQVFLSSCGENSPDVVVILGGDTSAEFVYELEISFNRVYIYGSYLAVSSDGTDITAASAFTECGISFSYSDGYTLTAECNGVKTGICADEDVPGGCNLLVGDIAFDETAQAEEAYTINFSSGSGDCCIYTHGTKTFIARNGSLR